MKPFIIYTYDYSVGSGGIKIMHKLCDLLNKVGFTSYIKPVLNNESEFITCPNYYTPFAPQELLNDINQAVVIYPEGVRDNPLECKNVVRWMLGRPSGDHLTYGPSDLIYWYMDYLYWDGLGHKENVLEVREFHEDIFINKGLERKGSCFTIRKGILTNVHPPDSIEIGWSITNDLEQTSDVFNTTERFYSYDTFTFLSFQAVMCGCLSIVIPSFDVSKEYWLSGSRFHKYGIAWGEDDIPRAIETAPLIFEEIRQAKLEMNEKVIKFAEHCQKYFK
jgi:hypothetical protein